MSVQRSPNKTNFGTVTPLHHVSDPALYSAENQESAKANVAKRTKRRLNNPSNSDSLSLSDLMTRLDEIKRLHEEKFSSLESAINFLAVQNDEIKTTVVHLSQKYYDVIETVNGLRRENNALKKHIKTLDSKIEYLDNNACSTALEIKNIPPLEDESKDSLLEVTKKLVAEINVPFQDSDVCDVFRIKLKAKSTGPIIVKLVSALKKESILKAIRIYNKEKSSEQRLNTGILRMKGPAAPIYVSESLTATARRLHYLARDLVKTHNLASCWTSFGKVYLKRNINGPRIRVSCEEDIEHIKKTI
ncbi:unnamed protein product [Arctia plantaginis]|uniref:Zinc finger DNA binding protein n=1 Tax=Arctia plantaginis TaxID=874455 RepID=A0A8S1ATR7_ARCPL|nr:unnamed protein product [Arctia plantaginis]